MVDDMMGVDEPELDASTHGPSLGTQASVKAVPLPKAVLDKLIYTLEEGMDSKALDFLAHISYAGISTPLKPSEDKKEIQIPPPDVFSVITNISLHPTYTTRQTGNLETDVAIKASKYLRTLTRIAGATNCNLQTAWQFKRSKSSSSVYTEDPTTRRTRNRNAVKTGAAGRKGRQKAGQQDIDITPFANLDIANEESVFNLCDDIWSVIGWALVCSCVYKKRWDVWRDFLELLIEVLTNDFQERIEAAAENPRDVDLQGSLITAIGFLPDLRGAAGYKRIVRAIFANGSEKSRNEWTPVFPKETKKPPKKERKKWTSESNLHTAKPDKKEDVLANLGANMVEEYHKFRNDVNDNSEAYKEFRDKLATDGYIDDDSEEETAIRPSEKKDDKSKLETNGEAIETWGGAQAIIIRLKLMALVSEIGATYERALAYQREKEMEVLSLKKKQKKRTMKKNGKNSPNSAVNSTQADREVSEQPQMITTITTTPTKRGLVKLRTPQNLKQRGGGEQKGGPAGETTTPTKQSTPLPFLLPPTKNFSSSPHSNDQQNSPKSSLPLPFKSSPESEGYYETAPTSLYENTFFSTVDKIPSSSPFPLRILPESPTPISPPLPLPIPFFTPSTITQTPSPPLSHQRQQQSNPLQLTYLFAHDIPTLSCFYNEYIDTLRLLPVPHLQCFISTSIYPCPENPSFRGTLLITILQKSMYFQPPGGWSENTDTIDDVILQTHYFPHCARGNDIESQVRMGTVLESLARLWHVNSKQTGGVGLAWSSEMEEAVEEGIRVRRERATAAFKKKRKPTEVDKGLMKMLGVVEGRLRMLVRVAKVMALGEGLED
ncbi:uncharacterized protein DFL_009471 [Arthrobotrys flagrans]|uniref:Uncharacterized protein n=1 Tax=Arthrobotrys flagrans TaxID=97331 RepID=A0A436ZRW4_ARTFL|nr:hypothetical protein DFL_009471 [Arthrobotrys flagrans]